jgi:membrane-bound lytic murein transglycosylase MltF
MQFEDRLDSLIRYHTERLWPGCDWRLIKAQVAQESGFRPSAESACGAAGLLQVMPATDKAIDGKVDGFDVDGNLDNGIRYLKEQFDHFGEITDESERIAFALAAYNGGRGYVNAALKLARMSEDIDSPATPGRWQRWETARTFLAAEGCAINGKRPDYRQMWDYVARIQAGWAAYRQAAKQEAA